MQCPVLFLSFQALRVWSHAGHIATWSYMFALFRLRRRRRSQRSPVICTLSVRVLRLKRALQRRRRGEGSGKRRDSWQRSMSHHLQVRDMLLCGPQVRVQAT